MGQCEFLDVGRAAVIAHRSRRGAGSVLVLHNLSDTEQAVVLDLLPDRAAQDLLTSDAHAVAQKRLDLTLPPFGYRWFRESVVPEDGRGA
jgi:hypothetical protein